jgi:rhamnosyltransferase
LKSSTGKYYIGLDHIRAIAAFMTFTWHFNHVHDGHLAPPPVFPLSLLSEGHTWVALFMTLSGYLFAKLLDGRRVNYSSFLWNRVLRLVPLLLFVFVIVGIKEYLYNAAEPLDYSRRILTGLVKPVWPNGGWSIAVEFHFYLLLPFLLYLSRRSASLLCLSIVAMLFLRTAWYLDMGGVQTLSSFTIIERVDQFIWGVLGYQFRNVFKGRHFLALVVFLVFSGFYWYVDSLGGILQRCTASLAQFRMDLHDHYRRSGLWRADCVVLQILHALYWTCFTFFCSDRNPYSYSIYLLHFLLVFRFARFIDQYLIDLSNIHIALLVSPAAFLLMIPVGWVSYRFIESPFLKFWTNYLKADEAPSNLDRRMDVST